MKTIMKKIDFWLIMEVGMWMLCALWSVLSAIGFWTIALDGTTTSVQWCMFTGVSALAIEAFRGESH